MATDGTRAPYTTQTAAGRSGRQSLDAEQTTCCVVGAGPAGAVLAYLLARQGIPALLLEQHEDFDRDFRGDTLHPSVLEIMDELGLAGRLLQLPHTKLRTFTLQTTDGPFSPVDFGRLKTRFPYIALMPQARFLEFMTAEAQRFPDFRLVMGATVQELVEEAGIVRGVRFRGHAGWQEVRALLTVGADGRFSRIRRLAGFEPIRTSPPMDVLWFRLPRRPDDPPGVTGRLAPGRGVALLDRGDQWQVAYAFPKGGYQRLRAAGLEALRRSISETAPELADRVECLTDWKQVSLLSVESNRCPRWYKPGLLLIGDAAHVMSPAGGVGINYAIADAVAAANVLGRPLKTGRVAVRDLAAVQRRREWPTRIIQALQTALQNTVLAGVLTSTNQLRVPWAVRALFRIPVLRDLPARLLAFGIWPVHVASLPGMPRRE